MNMVMVIVVHDDGVRILHDRLPIGNDPVGRVLRRREAEALRSAFAEGISVDDRLPGAEDADWVGAAQRLAPNA